MARARLSENMSFRSGFSPRRIFSTTFPGMGGRAGERIRGNALAGGCPVAAGSCRVRRDIQSVGGSTDGATEVDSGVVEGDHAVIVAGPPPAKEKSGTVDMAAAGGIMTEVQEGTLELMAAE